MKMMILRKIFRYVTNDYYRLLNKEICGADLVLDIGCSSNSPLLYLFYKPIITIGVEGNYKEYIKTLSINYYDEVYFGLIKDVIQDIKPYIDVTLLSDVIEHLDKDEALNILEKCKVISDKIIIYTPLGFYEQGISDNNPLQEHKSGWVAEDFINIGFKVKILTMYGTKRVYAVWKKIDI